MSWNDDPEADRILAQTAALLAQRGDEQAVSLLIDVRGIEFHDTEEVLRTYVNEYDFPFTDYFQRAVVDVDDHLTARSTHEVLERILPTLAYVAGRNQVEGVKYIRARSALPEVDENWRETYTARLTAERPSNQARRERGLSQYPTQDGMTFGSAEELRVYRALRRLQDRLPADATMAILPSPGARLRPDHTWTPDFLVTARGRAVVIEVDGPHHRAVRRRADDGNRDLQWNRCGVPVVRLPVEDLADDKELDARLAEEFRRHLPRPPS
jgi:hypothetical protein